MSILLQKNPIETSLLGLKLGGMLLKCWTFRFHFALTIIMSGLCILCYLIPLVVLEAETESLSTRIFIVFITLTLVKLPKNTFFYEISLRKQWITRYEEMTSGK